MLKKRYPFRRSSRWHFVRLFDFFFDLLAFHTHKVPFPEHIQNILVVRLDQMGDLICSLPVFPVLKERFPRAKVTVLAGAEGKAILEGNPFIDELIVFSPNWFSRNRNGLRSSFRNVFSALRAKRFDLGFDLRGDLRNIFLMTLAGVRYRIGFDIAGGGGLLNRVGEYDETLHQTELNLKLVTGTHADKAGLKPEIYLSDEERGRALERLGNLGVKESDVLIAVHPEAGYPAKEWGGDSFKRLVGELLSEPHFKILIVGLSQAGTIAEAFPSQNRVIDLTGVLLLRELVAVLSYCHLLIGNDSGPSHIAQALGVPAVVLASGTNVYERWGIWREPSRILKHAVSCSPCHLSHCNVAGHPCMSGISVDQVLEAAEELIGR